MGNPRLALRVPRRRSGRRAARGPAFRGLLLGACLLLPVPAAASPEGDVRMEVRQVVVDPVNRTPVVILAGGGRLLPIWIGAAEASSIARALEGQHPSRPQTHDLIRNLLDGLGAGLERVTLTELRDGTYFAVITLEAGGRRVSIDSRPSDAIAVALRTGTPIYAAPAVLAEGFPLDDPTLPPGDGAAQVLGMHVQDLTEELGKLFASGAGEGVLVAHVERGSPASGHGFRRGDVITRVDGQSVRNTRELAGVLTGHPEPQQHTFHIQRDGEPLTIVMGPPSPAKP